MGLTRFPYGVSSFGLPVIGGGGYMTTGNVFFVDSISPGRSDAADHGSDPSTPFATLSFAVGRCTADNGDFIFVAEGHVETIATATALNINIAGITIIGIGNGVDRPTFTVGTVNTATITISAAAVKVLNVVVITALDGLDSAITVTGADCTLDIEHRDTSSAVGADIAITASGARFTCRLRDISFTAGNQRESSITLNGVVGARIDVDYYGKVNNAVVEMVTTLSSDVEVRGTMYVSGTTDGSKNVKDTITGSIWYMDVTDASAGSRFTGGSAATVASDDISTINDQLDKAVVNTTATLVNGTTIFTVAGGPIEILSLVARCVTGNDATASTLQWSADPTVGAAVTLSAASASLANALAGAMVILQGTTLATAPIVNASGVGLGQQVTNGIVIGAGIITTTIGAGSTTGTWQHHLRYRPLARGVTVT